MANTVIHKAETRGQADHGWLKANHTFSFSSYYDPSRTHFGTLRVLNDDLIAGGMGFGMHPHDNMEIITIPLSGELEHKDSMNNVGVIKAGDVQVMSAGTGVFHSEYNRNKDQPLSLLQIWVFPNERDVAPRYDQRTFSSDEMHNRFLEVVSPFHSGDAMHIHQDAWFSLGNLDQGFEYSYVMHRPENGVYAFVIEGDVTINGQPLHKRDGMGISDTETISIKADSQARLLLMDIPMR